jgi:hypothetical protein
MFEAKLFEDAGKDEFQSALAVGHSGEGRVAGLVFEKLWKNEKIPWKLIAFCVSQLISFNDRSKLFPSSLRQQVASYE